MSLWVASARVIAVVVLAAPAFGIASDSFAAGRAGSPPTVRGIDFSQRLDANQLGMVVSNVGSFAYYAPTNSAGLEFPLGSGNTVVYAGGLWLGAEVGGEVRATLAEYSMEYGPGSMIGSLPDDPNRPEYKVYKLLRVYPTDAERDAALADYNAGAVPYGAPIVMVLPDGALDITGDQMLWCVYNDADPTNHFNQGGSTAPLGVEVQQTTFAFNRPGALGHAAILAFKIINKSAQTLANAHVGIWTDPDIGDASDDVAGCDRPPNLGFAYNATNADLIYGSQPPAVGVDLLAGPLGGSGDPMPMTAFTVYVNGADPRSAQESFNYLRGLQANGAPVIDPVSGDPTTYMFSGDPVGGTGWLDPTGADKRMMVASGPFDLAPGGMKNVDVAIIVAQSSDRLAAVALLDYFDLEVQDAYDHGFVFPTSTAGSLVSASAEPGRVRLIWHWPDGSGSAPMVERSEAGGAWTAVGAAWQEGRDRLAFEDRAVVTGGRYGYRLATGAGSLGETWVEIPSGTSLSMEGFQPNPAVGPIGVTFSLGSREPARLEFFDALGRSVWRSEVGQLGPGRHKVNLEGSVRVPAGLYWMELRQGARRAVGRGLVIR